MPSKELVDLEIKKILTNKENYDIINYSIDDSIKIALEEVRMMSMFSSFKVVVIHSNLEFTKEEEDDLYNYLENNNSSNYLIIFTISNIDKRKKIVKYFDKIKRFINNNDFDSKEYALSYLKQNNYKIDDIDYFISLVGTNINNITNELDKLITYKIEDKHITNKDIDNITVSNFEDNIFSFTDAIIKNEKERSMKLYQEFLTKGYDEIALIILLAGQFRTLFQVKRLYNQGKSNEEISSILGFNNPYRVKICLRNAYLFTEDDLLHYLQRLGDMDYKIKSGKLDKKMALELFLINKDL